MMEFITGCNLLIVREIIWRTVGKPETFERVKVAIKIALYFVILVMTTVVIHLHREKVLGDKITVEEGGKLLRALQDTGGYIEFVGEDLKLEGNTLWTADKIPPEWIEKAKYRNPRFLSVEEIREKSRKGQVSVIKIDRIQDTPEGYPRFTLKRWTYWWRDGLWRKAGRSDTHGFAMVKIDMEWRSVFLPPTTE